MIRPRRTFVVCLLVATVLVTGIGASAQETGALGRLAAPPLGLPRLDEPWPNGAEIALGRKLFLDPRLSRDGDLACAFCHVPEQAFAVRGAATAVGREGRPLRRNAPSLLNVAYATSLFHDGRAATLEDQVVGPLFATNEMANPSTEALVARIAGLADYDGLFERAFGAGPSLARIARAIAGFERTLLAGDSPFDRWRYGGQEDALGAEAQAGFALFTGRAHCARCHKIDETAALFTDGDFHFIGTGLRSLVAQRSTTRQLDRNLLLVSAMAEPPAFDLGRREVTGDPADQWRYKTPSLRNVALTAPYMHDGSMTTLLEVLRYYNYPDVHHAQRDPKIEPLGLTDRALDQIVAFLESLTAGNLAELIAETRGAH